MRAAVAGFAFLVSSVSVGGAVASDLDAVLFGSLDVGASTFATMGAKVAPGPLDVTGPVALLSVGHGTRPERVDCGCGTNATLIRGTFNVAAVVGYQWMVPEGVVAAFAGPEVTVERLASFVATERAGMRLQIEAWLRPTEETLFQATAVAGSARLSTWGRLAWGYRLWGTYLGPEASGYRDETGYRKETLGLHATDFSFASVHLRLSAGLQWETGQRKPAPYFGLTAWMPL